MQPFWGVSTRTHDLGELLVGLTYLYIMLKYCSNCKGRHTYVLHTYFMPKHESLFYVFITLWPFTIKDDSTNAHSVSCLPR
jgi:hypothetical protein